MRAHVLAFFVAASVSFVFVSCGPTTQKCTTANCTGCCDSSGECQPGGSNTACGAGGALCQLCTSVQACTFGQCVVQSTGNGGGGGRTGGGGGTTGGGGGTTGGGGGATTGGGGGTTGGGGGSTCNASTCAGCCLGNTCNSGASSGACGRSGSTCLACGLNQACLQGVCTNTSTGGGGGATGGGGGGVTGGGGGSANCGPSNCAGCCTAAGVCTTNTTPARCGQGGNLCTSCSAGNTCVGGSCAPCTGCVDISTGQCMPGTVVSQCGRNGGFCQACDTLAGQSCQSGACVTSTACGPANCTGCCDGNICVLPQQQTNVRCGQGAAGQLCRACGSGETCNSSANQCVTSGLDAGLPGDGGLPFTCDMSTPCATGCCDMFFGIFGICVNTGEACGANDPTNLTCQTLGCTCKASGVCSP